MRRILILGVDGLLGSTLRKRLFVEEEYELVTTARHVSADFNFDYTPFALSKLLSETKPDIVINCIAVSSNDMRLSRVLLVNSLLPLQLAILTFRYKYQVIHFSTNAVFSGKNRRNTERTLPIPATRYGISKLIGDLSFFQNRVIRTSFVGLSPDASVKSGLIQNLMATEAHGSVSIDDNHTWNGLTSDALVEVVSALIHENDLGPGIFHLGTLSSISREELVRSILTLLGRTDVQVNIENQKSGRNLSLSTTKKAAISNWWGNTKYREIPEFKDLWCDMNIN